MAQCTKVLSTEQGSCTLQHARSTCLSMLSTQACASLALCTLVHGIACMHVTYVDTTPPVTQVISAYLHHPAAWNASYSSIVYHTCYGAAALMSHCVADASVVCTGATMCACIEAAPLCMTILQAAVMATVVPHAHAYIAHITQQQHSVECVCMCRRGKCAPPCNTLTSPVTTLTAQHMCTRSSIAK